MLPALSLLCVQALSADFLIVCDTRSETSDYVT
jgi:hypothetical protein